MCLHSTSLWQTRKFVVVHSPRDHLHLFEACSFTAELEAVFALVYPYKLCNQANNVELVLSTVSNLFSLSQQLD